MYCLPNNDEHTTLEEDLEKKNQSKKKVPTRTRTAPIERNVCKKINFAGNYNRWLNLQTAMQRKHRKRNDGISGSSHYKSLPNKKKEARTATTTTKIKQVHVYTSERGVVTYIQRSRKKRRRSREATATTANKQKKNEKRATD